MPERASFLLSWPLLAACSADAAPGSGMLEGVEPAALTLSTWTGDRRISSNWAAEEFCRTYDRVDGDLGVQGLTDGSALACLVEVTGNLTLDGWVVDGISLPALTSVGGWFKVLDATLGTAASGEPPDGTLDLPLLATVGDELSLRSTVTGLAWLSLPALVSAGAIDLDQLDQVEGVELPALAWTGDLHLGWQHELVTLQLPALAEVGGELRLTYAPALADLDLSALVDVAGGAEFSHLDALEALDLPALATVGGDLAFTSNEALVSVSAPGLRTVAGTLGFAGSAEVATIDLHGLAFVGDGLDVDGLHRLEALDLPNLHRVECTSSACAREVLIQVEGLDALQRISLPTLRWAPSIGIADAGSLQSIDLSRLTRTGQLRIQRTPALTELRLDRLSVVRDALILEGAHGLTDLHSLGALRQVEGKLVLSDNDGLVDLTGLFGIESITGVLVIADNAGVDVRESWLLVDTIGSENIGEVHIGR